MLRYFDQMHFLQCTHYDIGPVNVCSNFEINRYKIDEFRKHTKMLHLTSGDAKTLRRLAVVFTFLRNLTLTCDLCCGLNIFYFKRKGITNKHKAYEWLSRRKKQTI